MGENPLPRTGDCRSVILGRTPERFQNHRKVIGTFKVCEKRMPTGGQKHGYVWYQSQPR
jgi:hypothetical protein